MTMALTMSQAFLGALTIGIGLSRGVESDVSFHVEDLTGEANYAASRIAAGHAKASNAIADDNVLAVAAMAPRLAVEADNVTMDESAKIACPQQSNPAMKLVCDQYTANKPRALAKLAWIREKQTSLWSSLEKLSGAMDKLAGAHGRADVTTTLAGLDRGARVSFSDPTEKGDAWGSRSAGTGCSLASKDALGSPMTGHAFPLLMPNLLAGLPETLVGALPSALCPSQTEDGPISLGGIPAVADKAGASCKDAEDHLRAQLAYGGANAKLSSDVEPFVTCVEGRRDTPLGKTTEGSVVFTMRRKSKLLTCTFHRDECEKKNLESESSAFLKGLGLPTIPSFATIGGSTRSPGADDPNTSDQFRAGATVSRSVDGGMTDLSSAAMRIMSFGGFSEPAALDAPAARTSTGKWYFPSGSESPFASVPADQRSFVAAWKHALVAGRPARQP